MYMREKTAGKIEQVKQALKNGTTLSVACADAQLSPATWRKNQGATPRNAMPKIKIKRKLPKLRMTELPLQAPQPSKLFMVCGDAASLSDFLRSYQ